MLILIFYFII